ncbi:TlpA family protein disulfide reductase [Aequorivita marina]|uniref:TlpA family protein disulfide reductase n=1 Tax=Aequorivita marina TaxID=3073654 RepID=UPI002874C9CC|nr:TlpA disulfide reductase family protein [Aequorivita sp. S2608]MDS1297979.1 TlpA disulfide reductase family protein [Aequorivita sp. S2608]
MNKKLRKNSIEYGLFGLVILAIYLSGIHTEVIGFAQRGLLATGAMNPDVTHVAETKSTNEASATKANFNLKLINSKGEKVSMEAFRGKTIFINFWATWCPPCVAEMPGINDMYNDIDTDKIEVLMVSFDRKFDKAIQYKNSNNFDFEVYAPAAAIPQMYNSPSIPTTFIIDSKGNLVFTHKGMADYNRSDFKKFLKSL